MNILYLIKAFIFCYFLGRSGLVIFAFLVITAVGVRGFVNRWQPRLGEFQWYIQEMVKQLSSVMLHEYMFSSERQVFKSFLLNILSLYSLLIGVMPTGVSDTRGYVM